MGVIATATGPLPASFVKVGTNTGPDSTNTFTLAADTGNGDGICLATYDTGPGRFGTFTVAVSHPVGTVPHPVRLAWQAIDELGTVLDGGENANPTMLTTTEQTVTIDMPPAPAGTVARRLYLRAAADGPASVPTITRRNLYTDPRCTTLTPWEARNSWTLLASSSINPPPVPGDLKTAVYVSCTTAGAAASAGINLYGSPLSAGPPAAGFPVVAGDILTLSCHVYTYKAGTVNLEAKCFAGAAWVGTIQTATAAAAVKTWQRFKLTFTVPVGANRLAACIRIPASTTWAVSDRIIVSGVMLEKNAPGADEYFDGTNMGDNPQPGFTAWEGAADASTSALYNDVNQTRKLAVAGDLLATAATAEDLIGAALERNLRRSVAEIFNTGPVRIAAGVPGLLAGTLTYLCADWVQAEAFDALHQTAGTVTIAGAEAGELAGLQYVAVERTRITAERATPGRPAKWLVAVEIREQE